MTNYARVHDFSVKDALTTGDPLKAIKGVEVDAEFDALVTAVASKLNTVDLPDPIGLQSASNYLTPHTNLKGDKTAAATATYTADQLLVTNLSNESVVLSAFNHGLDLGVTGVGGRDTGSLTNDTWYHVYAIYNPTTTTADVLATATLGSPTLPAGFTHKGLLGSIRNETANLRDYNQVGDMQVIDTAGAATRVVTASSATTATLVDCSNFVPVTAKTIGLNWAIDNFAASQARAYISANVGNVGEVELQNPVSGSGNLVRASLMMPAFVAQSFYYRVLTSNDRISIDVYGWSY